MIGINIDFLILNLEVKNVRIDWDNYRVKDLILETNLYSSRLEQYGTKIFRKVVKLYYKGEEFSTMLLEPYEGSCLSPNFGQMQIKNRFLYLPIDQLKKIIQDISFNYGFEITGINRLDLAVDGSKDQGHFAGFMYDFRRYIRTKDIKLCGRERELSEFGDTTGEIFGFTFGSRSSDRFIRFYNKTLEMKKNYKKHIDNYHKYVLGFDESETIYRFEIQLNRRFVRDIIDVYRIFDYHFLVSIFRASTRYFFDVREDTGINRVTNMPKLEFLKVNFNEYLDNTKNPRKLEKLGQGEFYIPVRSKQIENNTIQQNKIMIKKMFFRYMQGEQETVLPLWFLKEIFQLNESYFLDSFFMKKREYWVQEYREKNKNFVFDAYRFHFDLKYIEQLDF